MFGIFAQVRKTVLVLFVNLGQAFRCSCGLGRSRASRRPVLSPFLESGCSTLSHMCVVYGRPARYSSLLLPTSIPNWWQCRNWWHCRWRFLSLPTTCNTVKGLLGPCCWRRREHQCVTWPSWACQLPRQLWLMLRCWLLHMRNMCKTATGLPPLVLTSDMVAQPSNVIHTSCC